MGTRALVIVNEGNKELLTLFKHWDGYPDGLGQTIKDKFGPYTIVNGLSGDTTNQANRMGCFAAQLVAHLKTGVGDVSIEPTGERDFGEEYTYVLSERDRRIWCDVYAGAMTFFGMSAPEGERPHDHPSIISGFLSEIEMSEPVEA